MNREQTTIRLTLRMPDEIDQQIRRQAERSGQTMNQLMLRVIWAWWKQDQGESRRAPARTPGCGP